MDSDRPLSQRASRHGFRNWVPAIMWMTLLFWLSSQPDPPLLALGRPSSDFFLQKTGHFLGYAILALLVYRPLRFWKLALLLSFVIASLYAGSDEWHQTFVPGREGTAWDWAIDSAGSLTALVGMALRKRTTTGTLIKKLIGGGN